MAKARTTETTEEPIKSNRPSQRTLLPLEQRFAAYGDDSSDEEIEAEVYNSPITVRKHPGATLTISHHKATPLKSEHKQLIQNMINYLNQDKILTPGKKQIIAKEAVKKLENYDSPITDITKRFIEAKGRKTIKQLEENLIQEALKYPDYNINTTNDVLHLDLNASLMMQNLGIRVLSSNKVRETYFPNKQTKFGHFTNSPTNERIITLLDKSITTALSQQHFTQKEIKLVLDSAKYHKLKKASLKNKQGLLNGTKLHDAAQNLAISIAATIDNSKPSSAHEIQAQQARQIEKIIESLSRRIDGFLSPKKKDVSISDKTKKALPNVLLTLSEEQKYKDCVTKAYNELKKANPKTL